VATVRRFIEQHGTSWFEPIGDLIPKDRNGEPIEQRISNRVGFRRKGDDGRIEYIFLPETWKSEVYAGLDPVLVAKTLKEKGLLVLPSDGKLQNRRRVPGNENPIRCYVVRWNVLDVEDTTEPADDLR
jgi:putative DNA primase/helicase